MKRREFIVAPLALACTGCVTALTLPNAPHDAKLKKNESLMITRLRGPAYVNADYKPAITIINQRNLTVASAIFPIRSGDNLHVIVLPAGDYSWRGIYIATRYAEFRGKMPFELTAGSACYVGDLDIDIRGSSDRYALEVHNRVDEVKQMFAVRYPELSDTLPFIEAITKDWRTP